ncbi:MAG: hypothetical protein CMD65_03050 [Gammaproteobacteria bacterium]|nr:hypothetical protein [Gammaproteobacteria bacterium]
MIMQSNSQFKLLNFSHLMQLYEINYCMIIRLLHEKSMYKKPILIKHREYTLQYEPLSDSKYTSIFRLYYKYWNDDAHNGQYHIKPHLIFTLYKDAKILNVQSLNQYQKFGDSISNKIKINFGIFKWLKSIIKKPFIYQ